MTRQSANLRKQAAAIRSEAKYLSHAALRAKRNNDAERLELKANRIDTSRSRQLELLSA